MPRVLLGMPGYSPQVHFDAARAFFLPTRRETTELQVDLLRHQSSLLAGTFNGLWASALNRMEREDPPIEYFAMLHSDIAPVDGWLDDLYAELLACGADVLAAVVPIKDQRGLTSTGIERDDIWHPRRITLKELELLPETFTDADVGGELLLNTGCWICRLGNWAKLVHFTIQDDIVRHPETGLWRAVVQPEDWDFSRKCRTLGLKLAATKKIRLNHFGEVGWASYAHPYGWDYDTQNCRSEEMQPMEGGDDP